MKVTARALPTQRELKETFDYENGELLWLSWGKGVRGRRSQIAGDKGCKSYSYRKVSYKKVSYAGFRPLLHRLIWVWHNGQIPEGLWVDHINQDKLDNRIENLRLVTWAGNQRNVRVKNKTGLPKHVYETKSGRYSVIIRIGTFTTIQEAEEAAAIALGAQHQPTPPAI